MRRSIKVDGRKRGRRFMNSKSISGTELLRRHHEVLSIIERVSQASSRYSYEDGETLTDTLEELFEFLSYEDLESEIFEISLVPVSKRTTGRVIPDLTDIEHVCKFQKTVSARN